MPGQAYRSMLKGSAWTLLMRWAMRAIGVLSTMILARLLTPEDFGLVAMAWLAISLITNFAELGTGLLLIRSATQDRAQADTAWTVKILQGVAIALLAYAIAEPAAWYFREPRVVAIMQLLSLVALIQGFENIGVVHFQRELRFAADSRFLLSQRLAAFLLTLLAAWLLGDYRALVYASIAAAGANVAISYLAHPYRPRFSLAHARAYGRFSLAVIPMNIGRWFADKVDVVVAGRVGAPHDLGVYNLASEITAMLTKEVVVASGRGLYPNLVRLRDQPQALAIAFTSMVGTLATLCFGIALGLVLVARELVQVCLGPQWLAAIPIFQWLAVYGLIAALNHLLSSQILVALGREHLAAGLMWLRGGLLLLAVCAGAWLAGMAGVPIGATIAAALAWPPIMAALCRATSVTWPAILGVLWRPAVAGLAMLLLVPWLGLERLGDPLPVLLAKGAACAAIYLASIALAWYLAGQPPGLERTLRDALPRPWLRQRAPLPGVD